MIKTYCDACTDQIKDLRRPLYRRATFECKGGPRFEVTVQATLTFDCEESIDMCNGCIMRALQEGAADSAPDITREWLKPMLSDRPPEALPAVDGPTTQAVAVAPADHREDIGTDLVARLDDDNTPF